MTYYIVQKVWCVEGEASREVVGYITDASLIPSIHSNGAPEFNAWMHSNAEGLGSNEVSVCSFFDDKEYSEVFYVCWETTSVEGSGIEEITDLTTIGVAI